MRSEQEIRDGISKSYNRALWLQRHRHWFSRILLVPCLLFALGVTLMVLIGLSQGEIKEVNRFDTAIVMLAVNPAQFWVSVVYHSGLAAFLWFFTFVAWRGARWCHD